ncbi:MAG: hypothetical protein LBI05_00215 [Planctomycetaceae bacterium]|jgi:hypothetical protein|nr:hypothetical protein [Planctomycetaceae bacterium]
MMQRLFYIGTLFAILFAVGCSKTVVIKGTAKMADGTTIDNGTVYFNGEKDQYSADIQSDGTFSPGVTKDGGGIPPGVYKVTVSGVVAYEGETIVLPNGSSIYPKTVPLIDPKYGNATTSGLSIDTSKSKTLDLELEPAL